MFNSISARSATEKQRLRQLKRDIKMARRIINDHIKYAVKDGLLSVVIRNSFFSDKEICNIVTKELKDNGYKVDIQYMKSYSIMGTCIEYPYITIKW